MRARPLRCEVKGARLKFKAWFACGVMNKCGNMFVERCSEVVAGGKILLRSTPYRVQSTEYRVLQNLNWRSSDTAWMLCCSRSGRCSISLYLKHGTKPVPINRAFRAFCAFHRAPGEGTTKSGKSRWGRQTDEEAEQPIQQKEAIITVPSRYLLRKVPP